MVSPQLGTFHPTRLVLDGGTDPWDGVKCGRLYASAGWWLFGQWRFGLVSSDLCCFVTSTFSMLPDQTETLRRNVQSARTNCVCYPLLAYSCRHNGSNNQITSSFSTNEYETNYHNPQGPIVRLSSLVGKFTVHTVPPAQLVISHPNATNSESFCQN